MYDTSQTPPKIIAFFHQNYKENLKGEKNTF